MPNNDSPAHRKASAECAYDVPSHHYELSEATPIDREGVEVLATLDFHYTLYLMYQITYGETCPHIWNGPLCGRIGLLGVGRVVAGSPETVLAFGAAEQAVVAFTLKIVIAFQTRNAGRNLLASELCV